MLGSESPSLLVETQSDDRNDFVFYVVNGAWYGSFKDGRLTVKCPFGDFCILEHITILCDDQSRLGGRDYQKVFDNFHNPDWKSPVVQTPTYDDIDDDIPF